MTNALKKSIAGLLVALMATQSLVWVPQAMAGSTPRYTSPTYTFSFEIPDHGMIDRYHSAYSARDNVSSSLYLLRNVAVEDLLNTRQSLMLLLGDIDRVKKIANDNRMTYGVPGGIVDLYLLGRLGSGGLRSEGGRGAEGGPGYSMSSSQSAHGIDPDSETQIAKAIHGFDAPQARYDEELRLRVLAGLAYVSADLVKYDQQIKFIQEDFWNAPAIESEFVTQEVQPAIMIQADATGYVPVAALQKNWLARHKMTNVISSLEAYREYLLNRYHLLGVEVEGQPLYKLIYKGMQAQGFPDAAMVQKPVDATLPQGTQPIQLPTAFENAKNAALNRIAHPALKTGFFSTLYKKVNSRIDLALIASLKANTQQLASVSSEIDYSCGSALLECSSPLLQLARYDDLWDTAVTKYGYLSGLIDISAAREQFKTYWEKRDERKQYLRYTAIGVGVGIGIAGLVLTGGTAAEGAGAGSAALTALNIPLRSWLIGAGLFVDSGLATGFYIDSRQAARTAEGLFMGSVRHGSHAGMKSSVEIGESDYLLMVFSLANLGLNSALMTRLAIDVAIQTRNGAKSVLLADEDLAQVRKAVSEISERAEELAPLGKAILSTLEQMLGLEVKAHKIQALSKAVESLAAQLKTSPSVLWTRIGKVPGLGGLIEGLRVRDLSTRILITKSVFRQLVEKAGIAVADPFGEGFIVSGKLAKTLEAGAKAQDIVLPDALGNSFLRNGINEFAVDLCAEYTARGDKMFHEEKVGFIEDMVRGTILSAILVFSGTEVTSEAMAILGAGPKIKLQGASNPWNLLERTRTFLNNHPVIKAEATNLALGMIIKGSVDGSHQMVEYIDNADNPDAPTGESRLFGLAKGVAWSGLSLGLSSTLRYEYFIKWSATYLKSRMAESGTRWLLIEGARTANNFFGNWSYVAAGQFLGLMDKAGNPVPEDQSLSDNVDIGKLRVGGVVGSYFKVSGDETSANYMFDFLRGGASAGPEPIVQ